MQELDHEQQIEFLCEQVMNNMMSQEECPTFENLYKSYFDYLWIEDKEDQDCVLLLGDALVRLLYKK